MQDGAYCRTLISEFQPELLMVIEDLMPPNVKENTCTNCRRIKKAN